MLWADGWWMLLDARRWGRREASCLLDRLPWVLLQVDLERWSKREPKRGRGRGRRRAR